jgi:DNA polymerase-1
VSGPTKNYAAIKSIDDLAKLFAKLKDIDAPMGFDIETGYDGPDRKHGALAAHAGAFVVGFSFTIDPRWARYVPLRHDLGPNLDQDKVLEICQPVLEQKRLVAHNAKFEKRFMRKLGVDLGILHDTIIDAYVLSDWQYIGLKDLMTDIFGWKMTELLDLFPGLTKDQEDCIRFNILDLNPKVVAYGCEDSAAALTLSNRISARAATERPFIHRLEMETLETLLDMEEWGVAADWVDMERRLEEAERFIIRLKDEVRADFSGLLGRSMVKLNLASPKQIREIMYDPPPKGLGLPVTKMTKGGKKEPPKPSTDEVALKKAAKDNEAIAKMLKVRELENLIDRFNLWLEKKPAKKQVFVRGIDQRVHADYAQTIVKTGRFAAADPPIQQCPKKYKWELSDGTEFSGNFRDLLVAGPGTYFLGYDYSQIELRAIAGLSQDATLMKAFEDGEDVHKFTASMMLGIPIEEIDDDKRQQGKTFNFALIYQMGPQTLADRLASTLDRAKELFSAFFARLPAIKAWVDKTKAECIPRGYTVSAFGRKWKIWELYSDNRAVFAHAERMVVNAPVQGWAADYTKIAMNRIRRALIEKGWWGRVRMVMNQHDMLMFEVDQDIDPKELREFLLPWAVFDIEGMPKIVSDWEFGYRWGSTLKVEDDTRFEKVDGSWQIVGETQLVEREENPFEDLAAPAEANGSAVAALPPDPIPDVGEVGEIYVIVSSMPTAESFDAFLRLLADNPGQNTVRFRTPEGEFTLDELPTALDTSDAGRISVVLGGGVEVTRPVASVDTAELASGLLT